MGQAGAEAAGIIIDDAVSARTFAVIRHVSSNQRVLVVRRPAALIERKALKVFVLVRILPCTPIGCSRYAIIDVPIIIRVPCARAPVCLSWLSDGRCLRTNDQGAEQESKTG